MTANTAPTAPTAPLDAAAILERLEGRIRSYRSPRAIVAVSGGVDSAVVLAAAARSLGPDAVTAVTAISPSYPAGELDQARAVTEAAGVRHRTIDTHEVEREAYARNDGMRCYHCKSELYATLRRLESVLAGEAGPAGPAPVVLSGANADDAGDFRPGLAAGEASSVRNPLLEEGMGKDAVRVAARLLGLPVADRPAMACLSSRVAFGIRITPELLSRIDRAERAVRSLGYAPVRVRHFGEEARIEVPAAEVGSLRAHPGLPGLLDALRRMGWSRVAIDPEGYRTGAMNATLPEVVLLPRALSVHLRGSSGQERQGERSEGVGQRDPSTVSDHSRGDLLAGEDVRPSPGR